MKIESYLLALPVLALVLLALFTIPAQSGQLWENYGYATPTGENITEFQRTTKTFQKVKDIRCDINPNSELCEDRGTFSIISEAGSNIINFIVKGGFGALMTILKSFDLLKNVILDIVIIVGVPAEIGEILAVMLEIGLLITVVFLVLRLADDA